MFTCEPRVCAGVPVNARLSQEPGVCACMDRKEEQVTTATGCHPSSTMHKASVLCRPEYASAGCASQGWSQEAVGNGEPFRGLPANAVLRENH